MKKISFGSFPLTEIKADDRKCLDRYLIKTFSDNISISDAIRNLSITKNLMYITPDVLMKNWMGLKRNDSTNQNDRTSNSAYDQVLKRAFYVLKEFYIKIKNAPFYKEYVYYPIYVEKIEKVNVTNEGSEGASTETLMNYSFVILSNDLTKGIKVDEIRYDENASLNFLFLFIEFFAGEEFASSIHSFDKTDYEFLVKLYQFIEKSGKDPIHMVLELYKLLGLIKEAASGAPSAKRDYTLGVNKTLDKIDSKQLIKYKGILRHKLVALFSTTRMTPGIIADYRREFVDIMEAIFKSEGLSGLYDGVDAGADLGERQTYVYQSNKYQEILNLARELVNYNRLNCNDIIKDDPMDFDFRVEHGEYAVEVQSQIISQKYQTFFESYVGSISTYLKGIVKVFIDTLSIPDAISTSVTAISSANAAEVATLKSERVTKISNLASDNAHLVLHTSGIASNPGNTPGAVAARTFHENERLSYNIKISALENRISIIDNELIHREAVEGTLQTTQNSMASIVSATSDDLFKGIRDNILSSIANDLTFVFDDGKRFFMNEMVTNGFMELTHGGISPRDILISDDFEWVAANATSSASFPEELSSGEDNPQYFTAQVVKGLQDGFDTMASDTVTALSDNLIPAVSEALIRAGSNAGAGVPGSGDSSQTALEILTHLEAHFNAAIGSGTPLIPKDLEDTLKTTIYRKRFIEHVLRNFRKMFRTTKMEKVLAFDKNVSQLHPLIKKLISKGKDCQYFKSFIINYDTVEQLYNLKYLVDNQKFLYGLTNQPPRKLGNTMNRIEKVLFDYLGLKNNPTWLISKSNVYLSMPDDLSLTNSSLLSNIPKSDLMEVCKIKPSDYWNENTMGKVSTLGNKKIDSLNKKIKKSYEIIDELSGRKIKDNDKQRQDNDSNSTDKKSYKNKTKNNNGKNTSKLIEGERKKIERWEDEIAEIRLKEKQFKPNAFLFNDDPDAAENTPLLTDAEKDDLNRKKENMRDSLHKLNPYDDDEFAEMEENIKKQTQRSHPFDFEEKEEPEMTEDEMSKLDELLKKREAAYERQKQSQDQEERDSNSPWKRS